MIEISEDKDRGRALFDMYPNAIRDLVIRRKSEYFGSKTYKALKNNCTVMDRYIDNKIRGLSSNISDISPEMLRKSYHDYTALLHKFFENDPFFSVEQAGDITSDESRYITQIISDNTKETKYRDECFTWTVDHVVRYGTAVTYSFAVTDYGSNLLTTVPDPESYGHSYIHEYGAGKPAVISMPVHPLNAIFDPNANFMTLPDYNGILADITVSSLHQLIDNDYYIQDKLNKVIEDIKGGYPDSHWYNGDENEKKDFSLGHASIAYMYMNLPIDGNEDDPTIYAIEECAGEIIRIEEHSVDNSTIPIATTKVLPRQFDWFGNSPLLEKIPLHNLQHWTINTFIESTAKALDRIVFYRSGELPVEAMNARHQTGGLVPYAGQEPDLSKLMYAPNVNNTPFRDMDWIMQLARREDQETSVMPSFNPQSEGGPTNKTLGGAQMMASIGELRVSKHVLDMTKGQKRVGRQVVDLLKNVLPDDSQEKQLLLKNYCLAIKTSNVFNYARDAVDTSNRLTEAVNYLKTQVPEFKAIKLSQLIKDWLRATTKNDDIDTYYDENLISQQAPGGNLSPSNNPGGSPNEGMQ